MNIINVNKYPISQMLDPDSRVVFKIPRYQREYVWGTREWATLYNDLSDNDEGGTSSVRLSASIPQPIRSFLSSKLSMVNSASPPSACCLLHFMMS